MPTDQRPTVHQQPTANGKGLGRLIAPSVKDYAYRYCAVKNQLPKAAGVPRFARHWNVTHNLPLDQGPTPRCVGYSIATLLCAGPVLQPTLLPTVEAAQEYADGVYLAALEIDEWPGDDPNTGTSGRAGLEVLRSRGVIGSYLWAQTRQDVIDFLLRYGPVLAGTVWPDSMMDTDAKGYLHVDPDSTLSGPHAQGHEWCIYGVDTRHRCPDGSRGAFWMKQTWGKGWGLDGTGTGIVPFTAFDVLFDAAGDVAMPVETRVKPVKA